MANAEAKVYYWALFFLLLLHKFIHGGLPTWTISTEVGPNTWGTKSAVTPASENWILYSNYSITRFP